MRYEEITSTITASSPADWELLAVDGLIFIDRFTNASPGGLEADCHTYLAVYKPDIDLRLAWGLTHADGLTFDGLTFPDPRIERQLVDGFWRGALVTRWPVLSVDGYRCYLPNPTQTYTSTGPSIRDNETLGWTAKPSEIALVRLLQSLVHGHDKDFDSYVERAGIIVAAGE